MPFDEVSCVPATSPAAEAELVVELTRLPELKLRPVTFLTAGSEMMMLTMMMTTMMTGLRGNIFVRPLKSASCSFGPVRERTPPDQL